MGTISKTSGAKISTDALELLSEQHTEIDELFEMLGSGGGDRRTAFMELADKLAAHATVEEKIFYPAVMSEETDDLLHEFVEDHLEIKRILSELIAMQIDDEELDEKLDMLKESVVRHAHEEEEDKLFPILRQQLSIDERAALGNEVLVKYEELMKSHPYKNVPAETMAPAPLPPVA